VKLSARICHWCGSHTPNISQICTPCWNDRDAILARRKERERLDALNHIKGPDKVARGKVLAARLAAKKKLVLP
jgi:hypothetical protein